MLLPDGVFGRAIRLVRSRRRIFFDLFGALLRGAAAWPPGIRPSLHHDDDVVSTADCDNFIVVTSFALT